MTLQDTMLHLLDFYPVKDLADFAQAIEDNKWNQEEAYDFLDEFTRADYRLTGMKPNIEMYIALYGYQFGGGNLPPFYR